MSIKYGPVSAQLFVVYSFITHRHSEILREEVHILKMKSVEPVKLVPVAARSRMEGQMRRLCCAGNVPRLTHLDHRAKLGQMGDDGSMSLSGPVQTWY